jgi:predicted aconitase
LHVPGHTPEGHIPLTLDADRKERNSSDLSQVWRKFNAAPTHVDLVAIGSPPNAEADGTLKRLKEAGVQVIPDLCWCSITEPVLPPNAKTLMTNSGKYAHYAKGLTGRDVRFGSMADCARAARTGLASDQLPTWLSTE